ncbi:unnamed protein product [Ectocarpus sp. 12 AP-2014]
MAAVKERYRCASIDIGVVNLAFCVTEFTPRGDGTFTFHLVDVQCVRIGSVGESIHSLGKKLIAIYSADDALQSEKLDFVFIEQQLSRAVKNIVLAYITMAYFETRKFGCDDDTTIITFVPPKKKFAAVRHAFPEDVLSPINFERRGRELKKLSVEVARLLFTTFRVEVGLHALTKYRSKLDDVSDVFLQSFAFFLEKSFPPQTQPLAGGDARLFALKSMDSVNTPKNRHRRWQSSRSIVMCIS